MSIMTLEELREKMENNPYLIQEDGNEWYPSYIAQLYDGSIVGVDLIKTELNHIIYITYINIYDDPDCDCLRVIKGLKFDVSIKSQFDTLQKAFYKLEQIDDVAVDRYFKPGVKRIITKRSGCPDSVEFPYDYAIYKYRNIKRVELNPDSLTKEMKDVLEAPVNKAMLADNSEFFGDCKEDNLLAPFTLLSPVTDDNGEELELEKEHLHLADYGYFLERLLEKNLEKLPCSRLELYLPSSTCRVVIINFLVRYCIKKGINLNIYSWNKKKSSFELISPID